MFATATKNFLKAVDDKGCLIPVSSPNDSDKLVLLSLVVKQKRNWLWQKTKYQYVCTGFILNDVLDGGTPITPAVHEKEFLKYVGKFDDEKEVNMGGKGDVANFVRLNLDGGKDHSSTHQSTFGSLKKEEVDVNKLLNDSKKQALDMSHCLIQQTREKSGDVLGVVMGRILTINPSTVLEEVEQSGHMGADLGIPALPEPTKAAFKGYAVKRKDTQVALEIPAQTVIAYSIIEIRVQPDGKYDLCLLKNTGGFEKVTTPVSTPVSTPSSTTSIVYVGMTDMSEHYQLLSALPASTSSSLFQLLRTTMKNRLAITVLENVLNQMSDGVKPDLGDVKKESVRKTVRAIVDLLHQSEESLSLTIATHLIISAMDKMTDEGITLLASCCRPPVLQALQLLVQNVTRRRESSLKDAGLAPLAKKRVYKRVERLFACSDVTLKRQKDILQTETGKTYGILPLVMCITVKGLASLS